MARRLAVAAHKIGEKVIYEQGKWGGRRGKEKEEGTPGNGGTVAIGGAAGGMPSAVARQE